MEHKLPCRHIVHWRGKSHGARLAHGGLQTPSEEADIGMVVESLTL